MSDQVNNNTTVAIEPEGKTKNPKKILAKIPKKIFYPLIAILVLLVCIGGMWTFNSFTTFTTDNAKITAQMYQIMPVTNGKLLEWNVSAGDMVSKGQLLGRQEILPGIFSPIDGTIIKSDYKSGQSVSAQNPLAVIADTDNMYIGVNIEETEIMKIAVGQEVDVTIDAYGSKKFKGKVTQIDNATQTYFSNGLSSFSTSGTYTKVVQLIPIRVVIENPDNLPMAFGMNATVKIHLG